MYWGVWALLRRSHFPPRIIGAWLILCLMMPGMGSVSRMQVYENRESCIWLVRAVASKHGSKKYSTRKNWNFNLVTPVYSSTTRSCSMGSNARGVQLVRSFWDEVRSFMIWGWERSVIQGPLLNTNFLGGVPCRAAWLPFSHVSRFRVQSSESCLVATKTWKCLELGESMRGNWSDYIKIMRPAEQRLPCCFCSYAACKVWQALGYEIS